MDDDFHRLAGLSGGRNEVGNGPPAQPSLLILQKVDRRERRGLMAALDRSQCLIWFDPTGQIVDCNPRVQNLLSFDLKTMRTNTHATLMGEPDPTHPQYATHWERICTGAILNEERSLIAQDGSEIWCSISYAAVKNDAGATRRILAIVIDLSPWSWRPNSL